MVTRRNFIANAAATTAALMAFPQLANSLPRKRLKNFGYITGIIGKELEGDWKSVLKKTAEMGYTEIETGKYLGDSATAFLSYCREIGLKPVVGGIGFTTDKDELQKQIDALLQLEMKYAVNYWPWTTDKPFKLEQCKKSAEMLNIIGEQCKKKRADLLLAQPRQRIHRYGRRAPLRLADGAYRPSTGKMRNGYLLGGQGWSRSACHTETISRANTDSACQGYGSRHSARLCLSGRRNHRLRIDF